MCALVFSSAGFADASAAQEAAAINVFRFLDCEFFYNDAEMYLLLKALAGNKQVGPCAPTLRVAVLIFFCTADPSGLL